jgi:protein-disulfide isomerase
MTIHNGKPHRMIRTLGLMAVAALALAGCSSEKSNVSAPENPVAAVPPPAGKVWSDVVVATPEGGFRMGNPDAAVKLVEYASYTCPHCKVFEETGAAPLVEKYVKTGKVSWEYRSLLLHAPDAPLTLLMNCRGAQPFFALKGQVFAAQEEMLNKLTSMTPAEQQALQSGAPADQFKTMADKAGMYSFFGARGLPRTQAQACLSDQKALDTLTANQQRAGELGVNSTPSFIINDQLQANVAGWDALDPLLRQAVGG